jgi:1,2-diacylglycerol 3-beta-galactosyltransferase
MSGRKLLFLFSDTGGGHRSACEAVEEAVHHQYPHQFTVDKVDFFKLYSPWPFNHSPENYPHMVKFSSRPWGQFFTRTNSPQKFYTIANLLWPYIKPKIFKLLTDHPADLIVSFHPVINYPISQALFESKNPTPLVTVVTDLITAHTAWFSGLAEKYFVPTTEVKNLGLKNHVPEKDIIITGLPVSPRFRPRQLTNHESQINLLLMSGGQGMGKLFSIASSLNHSDLPVRLTIVAGRNSRLKTKLEQISWIKPVRILGFTQDVPDLMHSADILITKAGPGTLAEGLTCGLPIIIYDYLRGQETGNVDYVVSRRAGFFCPSPAKLISTLKHLLSDPDHSRLAELARLSLSLSQPDAAFNVAREIHRLLS